MEQSAYNSPPRTTVKQMIDPRPYNTDPIRPLPPLPRQLEQRKELRASTRPAINSDPGVYDTDPISPLAAFPWPQQRRDEMPINTRHPLVSEPRQQSRNPLGPFSPLGPSALEPRTPTSDVFGELILSTGASSRVPSPIPSPKLHRDECIPPMRTIEPGLSGSEATRTPPVLRIAAPNVDPDRRIVRFRNTPSVHEVERIGWRPVEKQRKRNFDKRRFRVVDEERPSILLRVAKKFASGLLSWVLWIVIFAVVVALVMCWNDGTPIAQPDLRPRIPPEFYFTHRDFRKQKPKQAPAFEYITKAARAGMEHLEEVKKLHKGAEKQENTNQSQARAWHGLTRALDLVKMKWDEVLARVNEEEKELIQQSKAWYDTKTSVKLALHSPLMAMLTENERRRVRQGCLEDLQKAAHFSANSIVNQARFVNASLDKAERNVDIYLSNGCGPWESLLLGPSFEGEKPKYLDRLPNFFTKMAPSWSSKWLERKRRRMQLCSRLAQHLSYFQVFVRIVSLSNAHLKKAARKVEELTTDSTVKVDGTSSTSPVTVMVVESNRVAARSTSAYDDAVKPEKTPDSSADDDTGSDDSTPPPTIEDIFRAWDHIVGGINSVIDKEFRA